MSKSIDQVYNDKTTAGSDNTKPFTVPVDFGTSTAEAYNEQQLAESVAFNLNIEDSTGNPVIPSINSFTATMEPDTLVADLLWTISSSVPIIGWIVKEDDTDLPLDGDALWLTAEPSTKAISNYNEHTLTARVRYLSGTEYIVSTPVTIIVQGTETVGSPPVVDSFSTTNPAAGSSTFGFTLDASNATHYKFIYNSNTPPLVGDAGWTAEVFATPLTSTATLDSFIDSQVYAYVKDATDVSPALVSFVDVTTSGDKSGSDWLWENNPSTIIAYGTTGSIDLSGSGALVIDGTSSDEGIINGTDGIRTGNGVDNTNPLIRIAGTYTSIEIRNLDIRNGLGPLIEIDGAGFDSGTTITIFNNKLGASNITGLAENLFKGALVFKNCLDTVTKVYGNWVEKPDGFIFVNKVDGSDFKVRHNWCSGMVNTLIASTPTFVKITNFFAGQFGKITGDITENIIYDPDTDRSVSGFHDTCNLWVTSGSSSAPFLVTRNRFYVKQTTNAATFQLGDGASNAYVTVDENTVIGSNALGQFSSGNNHKVINNKCYTPKSAPAIGPGVSFQIQRRSVTAGEMYGCTLENNTVLFFQDEGDGSPVIEGGIYYPSYGREADQTQSWPNHGVCVGTCDIGDNRDPTGLLNNEWFYQPWADGQGISELWRSSWNSFSYAGSDGLTPSISYDSPWIGDGGSQSFSASSVTSSAFGDGAAIDDVQTHDVLSLAVGGVSPYTIASATAVTNCAVSNNITGVIFTAGSSGGAFTYQYTLQDDTGAQATGTVSGTIASASSTRRYFDHESGDYVSITFDPDTLPVTQAGTEDPNYEYFSRGGYAYETRGGNGSPDSLYYQTTPYGLASVAIGDVETDSAEMVFHIRLREATTQYNLYISGMALESSNYNSCWAGFNNTPHGEVFRVTTSSIPFNGDANDWFWDDGDRGGGAASITTGGSANQLVAVHIWTNKPGFAAGKILVVKNGSAEDAPSDPSAGPAESATVIV